jgi:hypothetical protein
MAEAEAEVIQVQAPSGAFSVQQIFGQLAEVLKDVNLFSDDPRARNDGVKKFMDCVKENKVIILI